jgi:uncharacterized coiled-coil protein SlyX
MMMIGKIFWGAVANWRTIAGGLAIVAIAGTLGRLYFNYKDAINAREVLEVQVEELKAGLALQSETLDAAQQSILSFQTTLEEFGDDVATLQTRAAANRARVSRLAEELDAVDLNALAASDPAAAGTAASSIVNELGSLLECATSGGGQDCPDRTSRAQEATASSSGSD